ncbi:hypothetical protein A3K55_02580 [Candidatus Shapirobacteria bacterium RBG_13_44_7]|uniref:ZIP family metal transporter n=1 Tax=Candidatus Shapirobacteria bacterium RBG_13_44_7 TaxID=1802149 RepID=A0A1F7SJY4_9BACT|nr:MAG: hypothetical protein A3K55_02580 [Candidatus Shapirobacteria bacterium RBG_13_44_7]
MLLPISFATGALLGNVFFHLLPETQDYPLILVGLLSFFVLEKFLRWHHCHRPSHHHPLTTISLIGGLVHSFIDGILITTSLPALLAVIFHEIPQKISYYSIFVHQKISPPKALLLSLSTSLPAIFSSLLFLFLVPDLSFLVPFTAGAFIYLAVADLIPELHRHQQGIRYSFIQLAFIFFGISLIAFIK